MKINRRVTLAMALCDIGYHIRELASEGTRMSLQGNGRVQLRKTDLHVHTPYCKHTRGSMSDYVIAAIEQGLEEIGFLAHAEARIAN